MSSFGCEPVWSTKQRGVLLTDATPKAPSEGAPPFFLSVRNDCRRTRALRTAAPRLNGTGDTINAGVDLRFKNELRWRLARPCGRDADQLTP
jgi:hypothetical protein